LHRLFAHKEALAATANALLLQKCLKQKMWDSTNVECMQLQSVGKQTSKLLAAAQLGTLRQLAAADPRKIEAVTQRHYPFGESPFVTAIFVRTNRSMQSNLIRSSIWCMT